MKWPIEDYPGGADYRPPSDFSIVLGEGTSYQATITFEADNDVCGEGYHGYSHKITFENPLFNSDLWSFEADAGNSDTIKTEAAEHWRQIVAFIHKLQEQGESNPL